MAILPEETDAKEAKEDTAPAEGSKKSAQPNKMMSAARQLSKGNLGLGETSMASTVLSAMGKKGQEKEAKPEKKEAKEPVSKPVKEAPKVPPLPPAPSKKEIETPVSRKRHDSQGNFFETILTDLMFFTTIHSL